MTLTEKARAYIEANPRPARAMCYLFADELGVPESTLRKKLREEGSRWSQIKQEVICERILSTEGTMCQKSALVGYRWEGGASRVMRGQVGA
jgi:hypothetical protein